MDNDEFLHFLSQAQDHADEDIFLAQAAAVIILLAGIIQAKQRKIQQRNPSRLYLCRAQLLPDPRANTPWQRLWESQDDRAFITTMGIDVATFRLLLEGPNGFGESWSCTPIPRLDVSTMGQPRLGARSLDAAGALGMTLHYLGSAMLEVSLQQIFALIPSTVSRYLAFSKTILLARLRRMEEASIHLPRTPEEYAADSDLICVRHPLLEGAFGSIDGLSLPAQEAEDPEIENATYNGWKSSHCINNVLAFSPRGVTLLEKKVYPR